MNPQKELEKALKKSSIMELSKKLGVSRQTIYNWIRGRHGFTLKNWEKLAKRI